MYLRRRVRDGVWFLAVLVVAAVVVWLFGATITSNIATSISAGASAAFDVPVGVAA